MMKSLFALICFTILPFSVFAAGISVDFSVNKVDKAGAITPLPIQSSVTAVSKKSNRPCQVVQFLDSDLKDAALDHFSRQGDSDVTVKDDHVEICTRTRTVILSIFILKNKKKIKFHYVMERLATLPQLWVEPGCKELGMNASGEIAGDHLFTGIFCKVVKAKNKKEKQNPKLKFWIADSEPDRLKFEPKAIRELSPQISQSFTETGAQGEALGKISLVWNPPQATAIPESPVALVAAMPTPIAPPTPELALPKPEIYAYLGLAYHDIQNHFLVGLPDQSWQGAQLKLMGDAFFATHWWDHLVIHANLQADLLDTTLPQQFRLMSTLQKKILTFEDQSQLFVGLGGSVLTFTDSKNYSVLQKGLSPLLEVTFKTPTLFETTLSYSPIVGHSVSLSSATTSLLTDFKVHWLQRDFKLGLQADLTSVGAAVSGSPVNETVYGFAAMIGWSFMDPQSP